MKFKKSLALFFAVLFTVTCFLAAVPASADSLTRVKVYTRNDGEPIPYSEAADPDSEYFLVTQGYLKTAEECYDLQGVDEYLNRRPGVIVPDGQSVLWYEIVKDGSTWRLHGVYTPIYTVTYDANAVDAVGTTADSTQYNKYSTLTVAENGYSREGYEFTGWTTSPDGTGTRLSPGNQVAVSNLTASQDGVVTLYAEWKKVSQPEPEEPSETDPVDPDRAITLGIVTPKKMSVRFANGKVYSTGDSLQIEIGRTYHFQMCSNNWETGVYDDNGNGLCGTVVYSVRVSDRYDERNYDESTKTFVLPKGDPVLRTDINSCFMAYRYHFSKGDYNKQTGIEQVVDTPLESLSVNLPLGSTITSDAYKGYQWIDTANVFIERGKDLTLSYTDYYWEH